MSNRSQLGWVDFSNEDRERVKHALSQLAQPGTLDELGIGGLRDAFSDLMFPGFSTLQTRAKYFIAVPRIIRDYLQLSCARQRKQPLAHYLEEQEAHLSELLRVKHHNSGQTGISGFSLQKGERVSRQPSSIYWVGLRTWKLIDTQGSLRQFAQAIGSAEEPWAGLQEEAGDDSDAHSPSRLVHLDRHDPAWLDGVSIELTDSEARFLSEKLKTGPEYNLVTELERSDLREQALVKGKAGFPALAAWVGDQTQLPRQTRDSVAMAQAFSELIYGAHLRLNMLLVRNGAEHRALLDTYSEYWDAWRLQAHAHPQEVDRWLAHTKVSLAGHTRAFLENWARGIAGNAREDELDRLVEEQARANKNQRSILNRRLPEDFEWHGMSRLDYRWTQVRNVLRDVQEGLAC
ncbi:MULTISPECIES: helix-turn-helix domain-containing protein [Pseudomonas]|uniref:helix-turn-helix domain-containing protein n=1 Tax=Pseudomonas TaxID=286 RepID=UPI0021DA14E9|nr:helix-turn-helix domain-containing protein [Pseudomonas phytophila]